MVENDPWTLLGMQAALPLARRGYDCDATDALIKEIKERLESALAARDEAQARLAELEEQVAEAAERKQAVAQALILASQVRSESEREADDLKAQSTREGQAIRSESKRKADQLLQSAEEDARKIIEEARARSADLEQEFRDAGRLAEQTQVQLTSFVQSLQRFTAEVAVGDADATPPAQPENGAPQVEQGRVTKARRARNRQYRRRGGGPAAPSAG